MKNKRLTDKMRTIFNRDTIDVIQEGGNNRIEVYYCRGQGKVWIPYGGGPLYNDSAIEERDWIAKHIEEYNQLWPVSIRGYKIVRGYIDTNTFPGKFYTE